MTTGFDKCAFAMTTELAVAVPLVMAERIARMVLAGPFPSEHDTAEFNRMYAEKVSAFTDSWFAMTSAVIAANRDLAASFFRPFDPLSHNTMQVAMSRVIGRGLAPFHRATTENAVRLAAGRRVQAP